MNTLRTVERRKKIIRRYLQRRQLYPFQIGAEPHSELGLVVVIPCFNEPDILTVLASLAECTRPDVPVEVIVVINAPAGAPPDVLRRNQRVAETVAAFAATDSPAWLQVHAIINNDLSPAAAGVGLARKLGMDEAADRLARTRDATGTIVSLDADCRVSKNYLTELVAEFAAHPDCSGASIYFEHDTVRESDPSSGLGIVEYELHLRYHVAGQRSAGFPYAFHTVGSAMACRAEAYAKQGGMNQRQGGEDFYFVQKLVALGGYRAAAGACVYPAARRSDRVPFGTGRAMNRYFSGEPIVTFAPAVYDDLKRVCEVIAEANTPAVSSKLFAVSDRLSDFLEEQDFSPAYNEICANVNSETALRKRLFQWFNAFRFLKFAQHASRTDCPKVPVHEAATIQAEKLNFPSRSCASVSALLAIYRDQDRRAVGSGAPLG